MIILLGILGANVYQKVYIILWENPLNLAYFSNFHYWLNFMQGLHC